MAKVRITQIKSKIDANKFQKRTLEALGLKKNNSSTELEDTPQIRGMINKVHHLIKTEKV